MPGDTVLSIDGEVPVKFQDLILASAMAGRSQPLSMVVRREGVAEPLHFEMMPGSRAGVKAADVGHRAADVQPPARKPSLERNSPRSTRCWNLCSFPGSSRG